MKQCPRCGLTKPLDGFGKDRTKRDDRMSHCRACSNRARRNRYGAKLDHERSRGRRYYQENREAKLAYSSNAYRRWVAANPDGPWAQEIKKTHGLSPEQWFAMLMEQSGLCYLCKRLLPDDRSKVFIDHDHRHCPTGRSCGVCRRGMAHSNCNTGIGLFSDDPALLRLAADNLERAQAITEALIMAGSAQGELFAMTLQ